VGAKLRGEPFQVVPWDFDKKKDYGGVRGRQAEGYRERGFPGGGTDFGAGTEKRTVCWELLRRPRKYAGNRKKSRRKDLILELKKQGGGVRCQGSWAGDASAVEGGENRGSAFAF